MKKTTEKIFLFVGFIFDQTFAHQIFTMNKSAKKTIVVSALICVISGQTFAQQISLRAALDSALSKN